MRANIDVAIVTAAGYPGEAERFEQRVAGLLDAFRLLRLPDSVTSRCALRAFAMCASDGSAGSSSGARCVYCPVVPSQLPGCTAQPRRHGITVRAWSGGQFELKSCRFCTYWI